MKNDDTIEISEAKETFKVQMKNGTEEFTVKKNNVDLTVTNNFLFTEACNNINESLIVKDNELLTEKQIYDTGQNEKENIPKAVDLLKNCNPNLNIKKNANPSVILRHFDIPHEEQVIRYTYTCVFYRNYNIFFITYNGKFASWVYSCNVPFSDSFDQQTEMIFGERDYLYLEMFCSKFMNDFAIEMGQSSVLFAISIYKYGYNDTEVLKHIFDNVAKIVKEIYSLKKNILK